MADFEDALAYIWPIEGGFNDGHDDLGGPTNRGISLNFLKHVPGYENADINTIRELSDSIISKIYKEHFWNPIYERINDQWIATYIFDMAVNIGPANAHKVAQRALWATNNNTRSAIVDDGVFGPKTLEAIQNLYLSGAWIGYRMALRAQRAGYYYAKVVEHPMQKNKLEGWLNRTYL